MRHGAALALLFCAACSNEDAASSASKSVTAASSPAHPAPRARVHGAEIDGLRRAIDRGDRDAALALLPAAASAGSEEPLLRARCAALGARGTLDALRLIESARAQDPKNPDVYATAAEIYASSDAFDTAWLEIQRGDAACGSAAELVRARGILYVCRENGAEKGLELLEKARVMDPDLPFVDRALGQAHLLVAKLEANRKHVDKALAHVRASLAFDPTEIDAQRVLAELLAARGDFAGAIATLEALAAGGQEHAAEVASLHKRAGLAALLEQDRPRALEHFLAAKRGGLADAELGTGARLLLEESAARTAEGVKLHDEGRLDEAARSFREALRFEPDSIAAQNHLAVVLFQQRDFRAAAALWSTVLEIARAEEIELPEPVHLNLASALTQSGDVEGARATLEEHLRRQPESEWGERTRAMLAQLPQRR